MKGAFQTVVSRVSPSQIANSTTIDVFHWYHQVLPSTMLWGAILVANKLFFCESGRYTYGHPLTPHEYLDTPLCIPNYGKHAQTLSSAYVSQMHQSTALTEASCYTKGQ